MVNEWLKKEDMVIFDVDAVNKKIICANWSSAHVYRSALAYEKTDEAVATKNFILQNIFPNIIISQ